MQMKVYITGSDGEWFAQGLDVDHYIQGDSVAEVISQYAESLSLCGDVFLAPAPEYTWEEFYVNRGVEILREPFDKEGFPYTEIVYLVASLSESGPVFH